MRKTHTFGILMLVCSLAACGCQTLLYELQPHRLRRLNRGPAPSLDPEFSSRSRQDADVQVVRAQDLARYK